MELSVVIPARNEEHNIEKALRSIKLQTEPPDEIVVVDDDSEDSTTEIAEKYADKVIRLDKRVPTGTVRDIGVKNTTNNLILSTDADTLLERNVIETIKSQFQEDRQLQALALKIRAKPDEAPVERLITNISAELGTKSASTAFRKPTWEKVGGYGKIGPPSKNTIDGLSISEGRNFWKKIEGKKKILKQPVIRAEINELEGGFIPVVVGSSIVSACGYVLKTLGKSAGNPLLFGGIGALLGELGQQFIGKFSKESPIPFPSHDIIGGLGMVVSNIINKIKDLPTGINSPLTMTSLGILIHHLITEGFSLLFEYHRRSILGKGEIGRYEKPGETSILRAIDNTMATIFGVKEAKG